MLKYFVFFITLISFNVYSLEVSKYVTVSQNNRNHTIPIENNLTPESVLNKYRPDNPSDEVDGNWNRDKTSYSYESYNGYIFKGDYPFARAEGFGYVLTKEGEKLEPLIKANYLTCENYKYKTTKSEINSDKTGVILTYERCNADDSDEPKQAYFNIIKRTGKTKLTIFEKSNFLQDNTNVASCATGENYNTNFGNPIDALNGCKKEISIDFPHKNFPISRIYNSENKLNNSIIGNGWSFNFELSIITNQDSTYSLKQAGKIQKIVNDTIPEDINTKFIKNDNGFIIIKNENVFKFNKEGQIESIEDFYGEKTTFIHTEKQLTSINTPNGSYELTYNPDTGLISEIETPNKGKLIYNFKASKLKLNNFEYNGYILESYIDTLGYKVSYTMSDDFLLLSRTNKRGDKYAEWFYDEKGRGFKSSHGDFNEVEIKYDDKYNTRTIYEDGKKEHLEIKDGQLVKKNENELFSKNETNNFKIEYLKENGYGSNLNTISKNKNTNHSIIKEYSNDNEYGYYRLKSITNNDLKMVNHYNGLILIKTEYFKNDELINSVLYEYDELNRLLNVKENDKLVLEYTYIDNTYQYSSSTNHLSNEVIYFKKYNSLGIPEIINVDGSDISLEYDLMGRNNKIQSIKGTIELTLDGDSNVLIEKVTDQDSKHRITTKTFDAYSHLMTKEFNGYKNEYDYYDNSKVKRIITYFNGDKIEDQSIKYDGDIIEEISSMNSAKKKYSIEISEDSKTEEYLIDNVNYNIFKNRDGLIEKIDMERKEIISHQYNDNIVVTKTANNILILETEKENKKTTFSNDMGEITIITEDGISKINRNGNKFSNKIEDGKIIEHIDVDGVSTLYSYDEGELVKIAKNDDYIEFTNKDDVFTTTFKTNGNTDVLEYGSDYMIYPSGHKVQYFFNDNNDQLIGINFNEQVVTKDMVSNGGGDFKSFEYGNGIKVEKEFKGLNLEESEHKGVFEEKVDISDGRIQDVIFKNKTTNKKDSYDFYYDNINQIKEMRVNKSGQKRIEIERNFDDNQNIISTFSGVVLDYKKNSNQLSDQNRFDYDLSGNMTKLDDLTIVYNYKNHIDKVYKDGELIAEYDYNLLNQRSKAFYPKENITKYFYYDYMGRMIEEKIGEDIKSFIYLNYKIIGYYYKGELYFNHYSVENTIKAETNSKGEVKYFDYGFDNDVNEADILYYGQYKDEYTGLYYNYHRDYSHKLKRYLQIDPLGLYDGTNPYIYVKNNTLNYFDFYGLCSCSEQHYIDLGLEVLKNAHYEMNNRVEMWYTGVDGHDDEMIVIPIPEEFKHSKYITLKERMRTSFIKNFVTSDVDNFETYLKITGHYDNINNGEILYQKRINAGRVPFGNKCNSFIDSMYRKAGAEMPSKYTGGVLSADNIFNRKGTFNKYFRKISKLESREGDLAAGEHSHVGFVNSNINGVITTISASDTNGIRVVNNADSDKVYNSYYRYKYCNCKE